MSPPSAATTAGRKPSAPARKPPAVRPARSAPRAQNAGSARGARARKTARPARATKPGARRAQAQRARSQRRVSGPAAPRVDRRPSRTSSLPALRPLPVIGSIGSHAYRAGRSLPDSPLLDRLLRGRVWIGILAVLLFGLVALNVSLLELNSAAGHNADKAKALRAKNDRLRASVSRLQSGDRLEEVAGRLGLVMPAAGTVHYLSSGRADASRAARALRAGKRVPGGGLDGTVTVGEPETAVAPAAVSPAPAAQPTTAPAAGATGPAYAPPQPQQQAQQQQAPAAAQGAQPGATGGQGATAPVATAPTG